MLNSQNMINLRISKKFRPLLNICHLNFILCFIISYCLPDTSYGAGEKEKEIEQFLDLNSDAYKFLGMPHYGGKRQWQYPDQFIHDEDLDVRNRPNSIVRHIVRDENKIIYDVRYTLDEFGRRKAPVGGVEKRKRFLTLFGCSFTFGTAIDDSETLNFFLAKELDRYFPYNYGVAASGANYVLGLVESGRLKKELPETEGVFLYFFSGTHINRSVGNLPSLVWNYNSPYFKLVGDDLVRQGSLLSGMPIRSRLLLNLHAFLSNFSVFADREIPPTTDKDQLYFCKMLKAIDSRLQKDFPGSPFYVVEHPVGFRMDTVLKNCLAEEKVSTISFSSDFFARFGDHSVNGDGHPDGAANQKIVAELVRILKEKNIF